MKPIRVFILVAAAAVIGGSIDAGFKEARLSALQHAFSSKEAQIRLLEWERGHFYYDTYNKTDLKFSADDTNWYRIFVSNGVQYMTGIEIDQPTSTYK